MPEPLTHTEKTGPRPAMGDICSDCRHRFSLHWTTYDNTKTGCSQSAASYPSEKCQCDGFASLFRWEYDLNINDVWQLEGQTS